MHHSVTRPFPMRLLLAVAVALAAGAVGTAHATITSYVVTLDGPSESPPNASPGTGSATVAVDDVANTLHLHLTFSGLLGTTTASHIHAPTTLPGAGTAGVATTTPYFLGFPIGVTSGTFDITLDLTDPASYNPTYVTNNGATTASAEAALLTAIAAGKAYLNVHSSVYGGGEIRGFLLPAVTPAGRTTWGRVKALYTN